MAICLLFNGYFFQKTLTSLEYQSLNLNNPNWATLSFSICFYNMIDVLLLLILICLNGFFSFSELVLVSCDEDKLRKIKHSDVRNEKMVLHLIKHPVRFLSAIQAGITLIGLLMGMLGGMRLAVHFEPFFRLFPWIGQYSENISLILVIALVTYFSIVLGELVPKKIALSNPERLALWVAPVIYRFTKILTPLVHFLSVSTNQVVKIFLFLKKRNQSKDS